MKKYLFSFLIVIVIAIPLYALAGGLNGPLVPCGRSEQPACTLCDIFIMVQNVIDFIFAAIFILAPIYVLWGGFEILTSAGEAGKISNGKKKITAAVIGIIIALVAWTGLNMGFNALVSEGEGFPWPWNEVKCEGGGTAEVNKICTCGETSMIGSKNYASQGECAKECSDYCKNIMGETRWFWCCEEKVMEKGCFPSSGQWCQRSAPSGSNEWILSGINPGQKGDANSSLVNFINCMYGEVKRVYGNTNNLTITSISDDALCAGACTPSTGVGCAHTKNSCHYGGTSCSGSSSAVDFRATATTCAWLAQIAGYCGGSSAWINWEANHLHISLNRITCGCNEVGAGNPCP